MAGRRASFGWVKSLVLYVTFSWAGACPVWAADFEQSLKNLVTSVTGRIFPIIALLFLSKNIMAHVSGDPNAKNDTFRVVVGIVCLLGLAGVWNFLAQQVR